MRRDPFPLPSLEVLARAFRYDPESGTLHRIQAAGRRAPVGPCGRKTAAGYLVVRVWPGRFYVHRIAFKLMTGKDPDGEIDHANGDKSDNRWRNLRLASRSQNAANAVRQVGRSGLRGAIYCRQTRRWIARATKEGRGVHLGRFNTPEEAHAAFASATVQLHGEFART